MVKVYKHNMPRDYRYSKAGTYKVKILGNLKSASFAGNSNNGLTTMLISVDKLDKNLLYLNDNAFINCTQLEYVNLAESNILSVGANAFAYCVKLNQLEYNTGLTSIGDACFLNSNLSILAPTSYENDILDNNEYQYILSRLTNVGDAIFGNAAYINYVVIPEDVQLKDEVNNEYSTFLANAVNIEHIVFLGLNEYNKDLFIENIINSDMFGLKKSCTFEGKTIANENEFGTDTFQYIQGEDGLMNTVEELSSTTSYFNLTLTTLPETPEALLNGLIYKYDKQYVQYCMANQLNFIVLYIDSKTSARTKLFLRVLNLSNIFIEKASNAITFVLDRHLQNGNIDNISVEHYRKTLMNEVSSKLLLIHETTNAFEILNFPEISFISKSGLKFLKLNLDNADFNAISIQVINAAGNVFNDDIT